jgi:hypothetical protein
MATTVAAEEVPKPIVIVTNPVMAQQIRALFVCVLIPLLYFVVHLILGFHVYTTR